METIFTNSVFGMPTVDVYSEEVHQNYSDTCAIKSQQLLLNAFGIQITEEELRQEAIDNGWYSPGYGTPMNKVGNLLEYHGVKAHVIHHASISNLLDEVANHHQVIVGVDSGELWNPGAAETFEDIINGNRADHALIVGGFELNDDSSCGIVNLIDPGTGDFCKDYPMDQFEDAWNDSGNFMVTI